MPRLTQDTRQLILRFGYETFTLFGLPSQTVLLHNLSLIQVLQPRVTRHSVWAIPRSLAATSGISIDYFSCRYLDVSVPYVRSLMPTLLSMEFSLFPERGLPHSDISGSKPI